MNTMLSFLMISLSMISVHGASIPVLVRVYSPDCKTLLLSTPAVFPSNHPCWSPYLSYYRDLPFSQDVVNKNFGSTLVNGNFTLFAYNTTFGSNITSQCSATINPPIVTTDIPLRTCQMGTGLWFDWDPIERWGGAYYYKSPHQDTSIPVPGLTTCTDSTDIPMKLSFSAMTVNPIGVCQNDTKWTDGYSSTGFPQVSYGTFIGDTTHQCNAFIGGAGYYGPYTYDTCISLAYNTTHAYYTTFGPGAAAALTPQTPQPTPRSTPKPSGPTPTSGVLGSTCVFDSSCLTTLYCAIPYGNYSGTCAPPQASGPSSYCTKNPDPKYINTPQPQCLGYCNKTSTHCQPASGLGGACDTSTSYSCTSSYQCQTSGPRTATCQPKMANGAECTYSYQCSSDYCQNPNSGTPTGTCQKNPLASLVAATFALLYIILIAVGGSIALCVLCCCFCCWYQRRPIVVNNGHPGVMLVPANTAQNPYQQQWTQPTPMQSV